MRKLSALIAMALVITITGVYAAWTYSEGNATASSPRDSVNIALTTANDGGANGTFSFSSAAELKIDDIESDSVIHKAVLVCDHDIVITFTPSQTANGDVKDYGIPMKIVTTYTAVDSPIDCKTADCDETHKIITCVESIISPVLTSGVSVLDSANTPENDIGIVEKKTDGTFTWTIRGSEVVSMFTLNGGHDLILDSRKDYDDVATALAGHKIVQFTVEQVVPAI